MTTDILPQLLNAIQTSDDGDFLRVLAETTLNRLMDFDADNAIGAGRICGSTPSICAGALSSFNEVRARTPGRTCGA